MLLYSEKIQSFTTAHPCENVTVDGAQFRYILSGKTDGKTQTLRMKQKQILVTEFYCFGSRSRI